MATFTTKAFCQTLSLPFQCLCYTQVHNSIHLQSISLYIHKFTITHTLPLCVCGCMFLSPKCMLSSLLFCPDICHLFLCPHSSVFICLFHCNFIFPLLRLFVSLNCISKVVLYFHFPTALLSFFISSVSSFALSSLSPHSFSPLSTSLFFLCLSVPPSPCQCTARSLESAAKQRLFEKNAKRFEQAV